MKILTFSDLWVPFPGGAEKMMYNISLALKNLGNEVVILSGYNRSLDGVKHSMPYEEHTIFPTYMRSIPVNKEVDKGWEIVKEDILRERPDFILTHAFFCNQFLTRLKTLNVPIVRVVHNGARGEVDLAVYNSQFTYDHSPDKKEGDFVLIPPVFDDVVADKKGDAIGFIKPIPHKGVEFVYKLAQAMPDRKFKILRGEWQTVETIKEFPNIEFLQPVNDIKDYYSQIRILLTPSTYEDAGIVPMEAAKNGIPCISSNVMGLNETNKAGIVLPLEIPLWVEAIKKLDDPVYYNDIATREIGDVNSIDWLGQIASLNEKLLDIKFVKHYQNYNMIGTKVFDVYPTQKDRAKFLYDKAQGQILDVGCNDCGIWEWYDHKENVSGVDLSVDAVNNANSKGFKVKVGNADSLHYEDKVFDTVCLSEIIEHVVDPVIVLREACRVGKMVIGTVPSKEGGWGENKFDPDHVRFWTVDELQTFLSNYGQSEVKQLNNDFLSFKIQC
jgi:glycosyltransferase involved in cell wall biosynthesis